MKYLLTVISVCLLIYQLVGVAEAQDIIAEGTYNMGDGETPTVAESRALLQAKRIALEQAGTYVNSYSKVKNFQLTNDEIHVLASGLIAVEILEKKRTIVGDGINFWVKIKAIVSTDNMADMAKRIKQHSVIENYRKIQDAYDSSQKEIEELKKQLAEATGGHKKKLVGTKIAHAEKLFQTETLMEKGYHYDLNNQADEAIKAFSQAIKLSPMASDPYFLRGGMYAKKEQYNLALKDLNRAIELNSTNYLAYYLRGAIYDWKKNEGKAIEDYSRVINGRSADDLDVYLRRGNIYLKRKMYDRAIEDFNRDIIINPVNGQSYFSRGLAFFANGRLIRSLADYQKACDLGDSGGCKLLKKTEPFVASVITDFEKRCNSGEQKVCEALQTVLQ